MTLPDPTLLKPILRGWSTGPAALVSVVGLVALIVVTRNHPPQPVSVFGYGP